MFKISYYNQKVRNEVKTFPAGIKKRYFDLTDRMIEHGPFLGAPHTKALKGGLFEIRAKGKEGIGRAFYCTVVKNKIVILHVFIKKTQKTPQNEMNIARKRLQEVKDAHK
ncbi:MAG: type II toxin-antitoxin system RelE/ParE family toxin [Victivallaceae bacterium]|nr:type II toxin-antitoxin system RelE/ParE family toxin [Victivallaceae bacterium]